MNSDAHASLFFRFRPGVTTLAAASLAAGQTGLCTARLYPTPRHISQYEKPFYLQPHQDSLMKVTDDAPVLPHWINGHALLAVASRYHDITDANGRVLRRTPLGGTAYLQQAQDAAAAAQPTWQAQDAAARQAVLTAVAESLERYQEHLCKLIQEETSLDASAAQAELQAVAAHLRQPAPASQTTTVRMLDAAGGVPPFSALAADLAAALAAGQAVAVRSDYRHPSFLLALAELCSRAGLPDGAFNVAHSDTEQPL
jgi:malonate-semialdehyde dehydrogenase (acetylating)/methylmalonate-semialdehyde dehydrogenase